MSGSTSQTWASTCLANFALQSVERIVETLPEGALLQVRAHDSSRTDRILDMALRLAADGAPVMPTLQAHLRRSHKDAPRLIAAKVPVLLVKGTTLEPRDVAHPWGEQTGSRSSDLRASFTPAVHSSR